MAHIPAITHGGAILTGPASPGTSGQSLVADGSGGLQFTTLTKSHVGLEQLTNDAQLKVASNLSDLASAATARTNLGVPQAPDTPGIGQANRALVPDGSRNLTDINDLSLTGILFAEDGLYVTGAMVANIPAAGVEGLLRVNNQTVNHTPHESGNSDTRGLDFSIYNYTNRNFIIQRSGVFDCVQAGHGDCVLMNGLFCAITDIGGGHSQQSIALDTNYYKQSGTADTFINFNCSSPVVAGGGAVGTAIGLNIAPQKTAGVTTGIGINQYGTNDRNVFAGGFQLGDGVYFQLGTVTGTRIGTAASQKLGFFGVTPVAQPVLATGAGATVDDVISLLQTLGLCRQS